LYIFLRVLRRKNQSWAIFNFVT